MNVDAASMSVDMMARSIDRQTMGARLINKTLDTMNQSSDGFVNADYQFQKDVLSAATGSAGKGTIINIIA